MIEEIGIVKEIDKDVIWVETQIKTTCGSCHASDNCGTGVVAKAFSPKTDLLKLACSERAEVGQKVKIGIPERTLLHASALVYLLPVFVLVLSASLSGIFWKQLGLDSEGFIIFSAFFATFVSFMGVRAYMQKQTHKGFEPHLIALLPKEQDKIPIRFSSERH
ncbi:SoxR reducing system RseC family protein [Aestuariibacter sp. AA17]|uniref:SoxR reducing system RseC family protein n=1 Tax=Fluctibacter corallii TaxID=2984329 RepID=A0ABT3A3Q7_9ALTE|nr:SoxR reducing system RseC family protein [Aestuariibacter sp. AA17]MCV2883247.1 SoxR reducing system RseC family protein [Aestuariibacter sp. AA17]